MKQLKSLFRIFVFASIVIFVSCSGEKKPKNETEVIVEKSTAQPVEINKEAKLLLDYLAETGDYVNSREFPSLIGAEAAEKSLAGKTLVIDIRKPETFAKGHIKGAVNVEIGGLTDYFANKIKPFEYDKIILACYSGQSASYSTSLLRLMGYGNVYSLRYGMSGWNPKMDNKWLENIGSDYEENLETTDIPKAEPGDFPMLNTGKTTGAEIFDERISTLFADYSNATISADTVFSHPEKYYIINYDRKDKYEAGHIPGAVRYKTGGTLGILSEMQTIPADREIVVYCGTGHNSAFVTAYLRLFGYNAKTLRFGNNSFMHNKMIAEKDKLSWLPFTEADVMDFPVVK
ncbi:MAG TPA: rhodanese-like domain-containing protein [Draconibacterium sp.]|nr:rhodanese-like domain-containing protein [Draconibacterium sp.]HRX11807.1 rhodanese-like domain-containing protein [Draconibacterium sp.]